MANKLTLNQIKDIIEPKREKTIITYSTNNGDKVNIEFDTNLSLNELHDFVTEVSNRVFDIYDEFVPEYRDVATFIALIKYVSNIPLPKKKVDGENVIDIKTAYEWMQKLDIINKLRTGDKELRELSKWFYNVDALISEKIEFKKQEILSAERMRLQSAEYEMMRMTDMYSQLGEMFSKVDLNELVDVTKQIASKDERGIVNAVVDIQSARKADNNKE